MSVEEWVAKELERAPEVTAEQLQVIVHALPKSPAQPR